MSVARITAIAAFVGLALRGTAWACIIASFLWLADVTAAAVNNETIGPSLPAQATSDAGGVDLNFAVDCRSPKNDAVNCVYLFGKLHGLVAPYRQILDALNQDGRATTLQEVRDCLLAHKVPCELIECGPGEELESRLPAIGLFDAPRSSGSRYMLIVSAENNVYSVIDGGLAAVQRLGPDQFRQLWTGKILAAPRPRHSQPLTYVAAAVAIYFLARLAMLLRHRTTTRFHSTPD